MSSTYHGSTDERADEVRDRVEADQSWADRARRSVARSARSLPKGLAPKLVLATMAAAALGPVVASLIAGQAMGEVLAAVGRLVGGTAGEVTESKLGAVLERVLATSGKDPPDDIQARLTTELAEALTAEDGALRSEVVELLRRFDAVETAIDAATAETRDEIARALGELADQYSELAGLLSDLGAGLELVMQAQSQQLALHYEQLEEQRYQTSRLNLLIAHVETRPAPRPRPPSGAPTEPVAPEGPAQDDGPCPYQGLLAYQASDAELYFGRDLLVADLLTRFTSERFVAVVGPSGSGKSSLVRAGLLAKLGTRSVPGSTAWPSPIVLTPGHRPLEQLAMRLGARRPGHDGPAVHRMLLDDPRALRMLIGEQLGDDAGGEQVLVVDQFEEIFTLDPDREEVAAFVDGLVEAAATEDSRIRVVIALRADYLGASARSPRLLRAIQDHQLLVSPLADDELRDVIEQPAVRSGGIVEPRLVELILHDVRGEPGTLPLLSHALAATWARREGGRLTVNGYLAAGGVRGAIAATADAIVSAMPPEEQATARSIMLRLTNLTGDVPTRARVSRADLLTLGPEPARVDRVLQVLTRERLVTADDDGVEVAHEAVLREWEQLRRWIDDDRLGLALRQDLTTRAQAWDGGGRADDDLLRGARLAGTLEYRERAEADLTDLEESYVEASGAHASRVVDAERRRARRFQLVAGCTAVLALVAVAVTNVAFQQRSRADEAATLAGVRRLAAESEASSDRQPDLSALLALEADRLGPGVLDAERRLAALGLSPPPPRRTFADGLRLQAAGIGRAGAVVVTFGADPQELDGEPAPPHVRVHDAETGEVEVDVEVADGSLWMEPGAGTATVATGAGLLVHVDLASGDIDEVPLQQADELTAQAGQGSLVTGSPSAEHLLGTLSDGSLRVWHTATGRVARSLPPPSAAATHLAVTDAGDLVATTDEDGYLHLFGPDGREAWNAFAGTIPHALAFDHGGELVAVATSSGTVLYETATGDIRGIIPFGAQLDGKVAFSVDDSTLGVASLGEVGRWSTRTLTGIGAPAPTGAAVVDGIEFGPTADQVILSTSAGGAMLLRFGGSRTTAEVLLPDLGIATVAGFTADGRVMARQAGGGRVAVVEDGVGRTLAGGPEAGVTAVAVSDRGDTVAVGGGGEDAWFFDLATEAVTAVEAAPEGTFGIRTIVFSPDGRRAAVAHISDQGIPGVNVVDVDGSGSWALEPSLLLSPAAIAGTGWTADGELAVMSVTLSGHDVMTLYDGATGAETGQLDLGPTSTGFVTALVFGPGQVIVGTNAGRVRIHDRDSGALIRALNPPEGMQTIASLTYDEATSSIVAADLEGQIVGWTGDNADPLFGPLRVQQIVQSGTLTTVRFTPDGDALLVGDSAGGVRRLPWGRPAWRDALCQAAGRNLTRAEWSRYLPPDADYHRTCPTHP